MVRHIEEDILEDTTLIIVIPISVYGDIDKRFKHVLKKHKRLTKIAKLFYGKNKPLLANKKDKLKTLFRDGRYTPIKVRVTPNKKDKSLYRYILLVPTHIPKLNSYKVLDRNLKHIGEKWREMILTSITLPDFKNGKELKNVTDERLEKFYSSVEIPIIHVTSK